MKYGRTLAWFTGLVFTYSFSVLTISEQSRANCLISGNRPGNSDYLSHLLQNRPECPRDAFELRAAFISDRVQLKTTMVANRGFHNPSQGSFSLFEMVEGVSQSTGIRLTPGQFFFGHFTAAQGRQIVADQRPNEGALMVELIAWDFAKKVFNFYELIGDGTQGRWIYRGNSHDIQNDLKLLHLQPTSRPPLFGGSLRCAGCHINGGPIMKELAMPHNDWWMPDRILSSGGRVPDARLAEVLKNLVPAEQLSESVKTGVSALFSSGIQTSLSLREKLRPLFCPMEINLESDYLPVDSTRSIGVPSSFFIDPRLGRSQIVASKGAYDSGMHSTGMRFPETPRKDGDHAFLTPVKAFSDLVAIESLLKSGLMDDEFMTDVLAIDFTNPVFSPARCALLRLVPESASGNWREKFFSAIKTALAQANATRNGWTPVLTEALANFTDPARNSIFHRSRAMLFLQNCAAKASRTPIVAQWIQLLAQRRSEVRASDISKNPRGQILEPGFRVIFPEPRIPARPGQFQLNESCELSQTKSE